VSGVWAKRKAHSATTEASWTSRAAHDIDDGFWDVVDDIDEMDVSAQAGFDDAAFGKSHLVTTKTPMHDIIGYSSGALIGEVASFFTGDAAIPVATRVGEVSSTGLQSLRGMFKVSGDGTESSVAGEAVNHLSGLRLQKQLAQEEVSTLFSSKGELSQAAIKNSRRIPLKINNPQLKQILSERSGSILDWGKYETTPFHTPNGLARIHFYHNPVTGETYYGMDFKAVYDHQGSWDIEPQPKYEFNPPGFNP